MEGYATIEDARITDWDAGTIEYAIPGDSTYVAEHSFRFVQNTPESGTLTILAPTGEDISSVSVDTTMPNVEETIASMVAVIVETNW